MRNVAVLYLDRKRWMGVVCHEKFLKPSAPTSWILKNLPIVALLYANRYTVVVLHTQTHTCRYYCTCTRTNIRVVAAGSNNNGGGDVPVGTIEGDGEFGNGFVCRSAELQ